MFGCNLECWQIWASVSIIIAGIVVVLTLVVTLFAARTQFDEMRKARSLTMFMEAYKLLELEEHWRLRRFIYRLKGAPGSLSDEDQDKFEQFMRHIDTVASLVRKGFIGSDDFLYQWFSIVLRLWSKSRPFVLHERKKREDPNWAGNFEWLAQKAEAYRATHYPDEQVSLYDTDDSAHPDPGSS